MTSYLHKNIFVICTCLSLCASAAYGQNRAGVLREAHEIGSKLDDEQGLHFLIVLAYDAPALAPAADASAWCEELYVRARGARILWNRSAIAKNAALACSGINPKRALEMLMAMDIPSPQSDGSSPEDVRTDAAGRGRSDPNGPGENPPAIMETYYRKYGPRGVKELRKLARYLGDSGEYPYDGWRVPLQDLRKRGAERMIDDIFSECIWYYKRGSRYGNESAVFMRLLRTVKDVVSDDRYRQAREVFLQFNPNFDFNAPLRTRLPRKIVVSEKLGSRLQGLIDLTAVPSQVTEDDLVSFVHDGVAQVEEAYANLGDQKFAIESAPGYNELVQLAHVWGKRNPTQFISVLNRLDRSAHRDLVRAYLLLNLAEGMTSDSVTHRNAHP